MSREELQPRIAWGITGSGHFLSSCMEFLLRLKKVDIFLSKAGKEVLHYYSWYEQLTSSGHPLILDASVSGLPVTGLYTGKYDLVVIAPATSNTIAKMAYGIADNLITNLFAHAGKCRIPTLILPCDSAPEIKSTTPQGEQVSVYAREIDRKNIATLANWDLVTLADTPEHLKKEIEKVYLGR
ncbi:MAG: flavoprotein [Peptococcaceae bacterium]|nr:flavoprotein [Peptococcaceae bacterium]